MAKNTRHGGASMTPNEFDNAEFVSPRVTRPGVGPLKRERKGEEPSVGSNSNQSTTTQNSEPETPDDRDQSPAPETDNLSSGNQGADTAPSVDGSTQETERESPSPRPPRKAPSKPAKKTTGRARVRSIDDMDDEF
jgi:hypothetical protein